MLTRNREVFGSPKYLNAGPLLSSSVTFFAVEGFVFESVSTVAGFQSTVNSSNLKRNNSNRFH